MSRGRTDMGMDYLVDKVAELEEAFDNAIVGFNLVYRDSSSFTIAANSYTWISVAGPTGAIGVAGYYIMSGSNTKTNTYNISFNGTNASFALSNLTSSASTSTLRVWFYVPIYGRDIR